MFTHEEYDWLKNVFRFLTTIFLTRRQMMIRPGPNPNGRARKLFITLAEIMSQSLIQHFCRNILVFSPAHNRYLDNFMSHVAFIDFLTPRWPGIIADIKKLHHYLGITDFVLSVDELVSECFNSLNFYDNVCEIDRIRFKQRKFKDHNRKVCHIFARFFQTQGNFAPLEFL